MVGISKSHLAADGGDASAAALGTLIHGGKLALVVHLQQLQSPGAVAHLGGTETWRVLHTAQSESGQRGPDQEASPLGSPG